jgi:murein DD-endopeptidase MepM/ murein hydrolase activator NlpD
VAADSSATVAGIRAQQLKAEADMRRADRQIAKLSRLRRSHTRLVQQAGKRLDAAVARKDRVRQRALEAHRRLDKLELRLARVTRVRPDPKGRQAADAPRLRKTVGTQRAKVREAEAKLRQAQRLVERVRDLKQSRRGKPTKVRLAKRAAERERAEARLSAAITAMSAVARERAERALAVGASRLARPVKGKVSQAYGCTGGRYNPPRGSCAHFHDGLDIAAKAGTKVRAAAPGVVAYVGFNPWDQGARAYVVIIEHARGVQTVYAHLTPKRLVRAGARVERGEVIGLVGMTGTTTGPHVHWEVTRNGVSVDPQQAGR